MLSLYMYVILTELAYWSFLTSGFKSRILSSQIEFSWHRFCDKVSNLIWLHLLKCVSGKDVFEYWDTIFNYLLGCSGFS